MAAARIFHRLAFRFDLAQPSAVFHLHDLVAQECGALELQIRGDNIMAEFLARGSVEGLDTACTDPIRRPPFVVKKGEPDSLNP